jgi:hypothetical protein
MYKHVGCLISHDLKSDDFTACRPIGGAMAWLGYDGLLRPSARAPGTNIVLVDNLSTDSVFERLAAEELSV